MAKGALIAAMDFSNVDAGEFNDWYDTEHIPERQRVSGFLTLQRWIGAENPRQSVATYDLDSLEVLRSPGYRAIGGENLSPWSKRVTAKVERLLRYEGEQILPGDATAPANAGGLLLVGMTPGPDVETAFNTWYDKEHVPALASVPGVLCARRFRTSGGGTKYIALYHLASPGVVDTPEWKDASGSTPMPQRVRDQINNRLRLVCRNYVRAQAEPGDDRWHMEQLPGLPVAAFDKADPSPDAEFYAYPRLVTHIDDAAIATVTRVYRERLPPGGTMLDLMSSWVSHLPEDIAYAAVIGHGMNEEELAANPRLSRWFVQDLNIEPALPFGDGVFDGVCLCVSVQYLQRPVEVFREIWRVLRPDAPFVVSFSNRCFPTKAVAIWQSLSGPDQQRLVGAYMRAAGFSNVTRQASTPRQGDPLWVVIGIGTLSGNDS